MPDRRELPGRPFLKDTLTMTEEPGHFLRVTPSRMILVDPSVWLPAQQQGGSPPDTKPPSAPAPRQWTQTDQDETDAEERRRVMKELVHSWMDRLQLISVITTFFAATEAQLLGFTIPETEDVKHSASRIQDAATATLAGALVIHLCAAIIAFLAAFFLIRYRLREARREEIKVETGLTPATSSSEVHIWSANPHLEQVGPFRRGPPMRLLEHCHSICMWLAAVGFALALAGMLCYAWARLPNSASTFASICLAVSLAAFLGAVGVVAFF